MALYGQCRAGAQINFPKSGRGLGHVTPTIFGSTVGYPSDSLASCFYLFDNVLKLCTVEPQTILAEHFSPCHLILFAI